MDSSDPFLASALVAPSLHALLQKNSELGGRKLRKSANYIDLYERIFAQFVGRRPRILEIGIQHGGSLQLWKEFFQGDVELFGIDILPECKRFEEENIHVLFGDQSDPKFLADASKRIGRVDIIIDDGSHIPRHQIAAFESLFYNNLKDDGYYIVEDCVTSYWPEYGGGLKRRGTFVEYSKDLCDSLNAWAVRRKNLPITDATLWIKRITFEYSLVVFEKQAMTAPPVISSGTEEIDTQDIFGNVGYGWLLNRLRRFAPLRYAVRNNQLLWRSMRRAIERKQEK
jgi:cephalosporin hydroxylase